MNKDCIYVVNNENEIELYNRLLETGIDSLDDYFDLIKKTVYKDNKSIVKKNKRYINIEPLINRIKNHKITKTDIKVLALTILFCTGIISVGKITKDINDTKEKKEMASKIVKNEKDYLLEKGIIVESAIGKKDSVDIVSNANYKNITSKDITPLEVFNFMLFIQSNYNDLYMQKKLLNDFIQAQTYDNGNKYYLDWNDYLMHNKFDSERDFVDYCYQSIDKNKVLVRKI